MNDSKKKVLKTRSDMIAPSKMADRRETLTKPKLKIDTQGIPSPIFDLNSKLSKDGKASTTLQLTNNVDDLYQLVQDVHNIVTASNTALTATLASIDDTVESK